MIDPHVHLRDGRERHKETIEHGLRVAQKLGLSAVFDMPNTDPPILRRADILQRLDLAKKVGSNVFYGVFCGLTTDPKQVREAISCVKEIKEVVGLKLFAGSSTGDLSVPDTAGRETVFKTLVKNDYRGVIAVHCEEESDFRPEAWDPKFPMTHTLVRPPAAELHAIENMIELATKHGFKGILHICHVSLPQSVERIESARTIVDFRITCGATPHHLMLDDNMMQNENGLLLKVNPPLRNKSAQSELMQMLLSGRIDWIETDHAPHTLQEKTEPPYASGIPGLPVIPYLLKVLRGNGCDEEFIANITHNRICNIFGLQLPYREVCDIDLAEEYPFNAYTMI
jgi:dihydroorotase